MKKASRPYRTLTWHAERLEPRRLMSGEHGEVDTTPLADLSSQDGSEARSLAAAAKLAKASTGIGPMPSSSYGGVTPNGVVGGTATMGRQPTGALTGKVVFTVGGHGFTSYSGGWHTQRDEVAGTEMVEDLGNQDQMTFYVNHLWNAGATVVPLRPVGYQPNEIILDNDSPGVTYTGSWSNSTSTIFYGSPGDVPYRYSTVSATQTSTAKFTPTVTVAGVYPVYTWVKDETDRINQLYRVAHAGGVTEVRVDHSKVGRGYVYLGSYYFNTGTAGYVEISNQGVNAGSSVVIADHIRFGNGMGDIDRGQGVSGQTRSDESALYWIEHQRGQGVPDSDFRGAIGTDDTDNVAAPPMWAAHMNREQPGTNNEIFLSFHSNAGGGRGTVGLYNGNNDPGAKTPFQAQWADLVARETRDDMFAIGSPPLEVAWNDRTLTWDRPDFEFGEINNLVINDEFDATILEVAFHDSTSDAALMRDPKVRDWVARASLQATIKYFNQYGGNANVTLPSEAPTNVRAVTQNNGDVIVSWAAPPTLPGGGSAATGYVVYGGASGFGFNTGTVVAGVGTLSLTIPAAQIAAGANYFRVSATNAGGESMPSETVAARTAGSGGRVLIVNGFDRLDRTLNPTQTTKTDTAQSSPKTFERVRPRFSNSYDYIVQAAEAIESFVGGTVRFDSASNEAVIAGQVNLGSYAAVIWLSGEEGVADKTFDATERSLITNYLGAGGKLFVSGAEIGFDLDASGTDATFYNTKFRADYAADDAASGVAGSTGAYTASGAAGSIFAGISLTFDDGTNGTYDVGTPDRITPLNGSTLAMSYTAPGGTGGAAIQHTDGATGSRVVYLGFPFETITTAANRNAVMSAVLNYFNVTGAGGVGTLAGRVVRDVNGDGIWNASETGLSAWTVFIDGDGDGVLDAGEASTTADALGDWSLSNLPAGPAAVRVIQQSGWQLTAPSGGVYNTNVIGGSTVSGLNFTQFKVAFAGTSGADEWTMKMDPVGKVQIIETLSGQAPFMWSIFKSSLTAQVTFDGQAGDDTLTLDYSNFTAPIGSGGASFTGGANVSGGDHVVITGSSSGDTVNLTGGTITSGGGTTTYAGVEKITANLAGGDDTINFNTPTAALTYNGGASTTNDWLVLVGGTFSTAVDAIVGTAKLNVGVNSGTTAVFDSTQHLNSLVVTSGGVASITGGGNKVLSTRGLNVQPGGRLDLADNDLIYDYSGGSPITTVFNNLVAGRNGGDWLGNGIGSSVAGSSGLTGLALSPSNGIFDFSSNPTQVWNGETIDSTAILIKYTYVGDANLDGIISGDDYSTIDFKISVPGATGYWNGDFNYDNLISGDDYAAIDFNIAAQNAAL